MANKLRGIAALAGLIGLAMIFVAVMPGRLVMYTGFHWLEAAYRHEFKVVSAGGLVGALHAAALVLLAFRLWRQPRPERAWAFIVIAPVLELVIRGIDLVIWHDYARSPTLTGHIYDVMQIAELAIALVVLPLALWLARGTSDAPNARALRR